MNDLNNVALYTLQGFLLNDFYDASLLTLCRFLLNDFHEASFCSLLCIVLDLELESRKCCVGLGERNLMDIVKQSS